MSFESLYTSCLQLIQQIDTALHTKSLGAIESLCQRCQALALQLEGKSPFGPTIARNIAQLLPHDRTHWYLPALLEHWKDDANLFLHQCHQSQGLSLRGEQQIESLYRLRPLLPTLLSQPYPYEVTIAVTAYNKLDYTKLAVQSILQFTDFSSQNVELLLIDNGSTDQTDAYFASIPHAKVIHLPEPLGYPATSIGSLVAKGRYYVHFANDIIATPGYLEGLLSCIRSDNRIGLVVPVCNAMSSSQSIPVSYDDPRENLGDLITFAQSYNHSDATKWEFRPRLLPCMSIMPTALSRVCRNDPWFRYGEFADDDVSTRLRRAGYLQVFAKDTFVHHFGSVTASTIQSQVKTLPESRFLFQQKWGVDAWGSMDWDTTIADFLCKELSSSHHRILWIDPRFGTLPLYCQTLCKKKHQTIASYILASDPNYQQDASALACQAYVDSLIHGITHFCTTFDAIVFCRDLSCYPQQVLSQVLPQLANRLSSQGRLFCTVKNHAAYQSLFGLCQQAFDPPYGGSNLLYHAIDLSTLLDSVHKSGLHEQVFYKDNVSGTWVAAIEDALKLQESLSSQFLCKFTKENKV